MIRFDPANEDISKSIERSGKLFEEQIKPHLLKEWRGELLSIEAQAHSPLNDIFDRGTSSDVILSYFKTRGPTLTIASRMSFLKPDLKKKPGAWDADFTLRCSYINDGKIGFNCELEKLLRAADFFKQNVPVVIPFYYIKARFFQEDNEVYRLYDLAVVETQRLLDLILDPSKFNWNENKKKVTPACNAFDLFSPRRLAGFDFTKDDKKGFVYLKLEYLEDCGVPYFYKRIYGDQYRLDGRLFEEKEEVLQVQPTEPLQEQVASTRLVDEVSPQTRPTRKL